MLRSRVSSDIDELSLLHERYWWLPTGYTIRPTNDVLAIKYNVMDNIEKEWRSLRDFVLHIVFMQTVIRIDDRLCCPEIINIAQWKFEPCMFPYNLEKGANHWILWNSKYDYSKEFDDDLINAVLTRFITCKVISNNFDFAWYKNPKPSVRDFYHVQVFWTA